MKTSEEPKMIFIYWITFSLIIHGYDKLMTWTVTTKYHLPKKKKKKVSESESESAWLYDFSKEK